MRCPSPRTIDLAGIMQGECQNNKDDKGVYMDAIIGRQPNFLY